MSEAQKGEKNHMFGKTHLEVTKEKMSLAKIGVKNNMYGKTHSEEIKLKLSQANGTKIYLYSLEKISIEILPSAKKAAIHFKSTNATIIKYARSGEIFRNQYILSLKKLSS